MFCYLIDAAFGVTPFPLRSLNLSLSQDPIHIYCLQLWAINYKIYFDEICDSFMISLYNMFKNQTTARFSQGALNSIKEIGH
jgi:hypothetical protein